jgi:hypothetical protein
VLRLRQVDEKLSAAWFVRQEIAEGCVKGSDWGIWIGGAAKEGTHAFYHKLHVEKILFLWKMVPRGIQRT